MRTRLVSVGNSRGVRIPKALLEQTGLAEEVEMEIHDHSILIRPVSKTRENWGQAFAQMARKGDDVLLDEADSPGSGWDEDEWQW
jgi:antitoxin MazE